MIYPRSRIFLSISEWCMCPSNIQTNKWCCIVLVLLLLCVFLELILQKFHAELPKKWRKWSLLSKKAWFLYAFSPWFSMTLYSFFIFQTLLHWIYCFLSYFPRCFSALCWYFGLYKWRIIKRTQWLIYELGRCRQQKRNLSRIISAQNCQTQHQNLTNVG